jgi:hypothetical protein
LFSEAAEATEVPWEEGARLINECTYLFAKEIREIEELTLGLTIVEAKRSQRFERRTRIPNVGLGTGFPRPTIRVTTQRRAAR